MSENDQTAQAAPKTEDESVKLANKPADQFSPAGPAPVDHKATDEPKPAQPPVVEKPAEKPAEPPAAPAPAKPAEDGAAPRPAGPEAKPAEQSAPAAAPAAPAPAPAAPAAVPAAPAPVPAPPASSVPAAPAAPVAPVPEKPAEPVAKPEVQPAEATRVAEPAPAAPPRNGDKRKPVEPAQAHVLVVEDNVPNFVLIARMLAYMGVQRCEWKTSGWQVVEFADTLPRIDLILMDIRLPYEDGFQALEKVRANPRLKETLVVAVTAEASVEQMKRAQEAGFDGFLGKPLDPDRFPDQIRRVLNGDPVWEMH